MHTPVCASLPSCTNTMVIILKGQVTGVTIYSWHILRQLDTVNKVTEDITTVDPFSLAGICIAQNSRSSLNTLWVGYNKDDRQ